MNKNRIIGGAAIILLMLVGAWWMGWFEREDSAVAEFRELVVQPQSDAKKGAMRDFWRQRTEGLSDEQRMQFFEQMAPVFIPLMMARFEQEYDKFMAMSPEEQRRELDRRIDEMKRRGPPQGGQRAGGGGRPNVDPAKMNEFRKKMLDWVSPEQRGKFQNGMQLFNNRLKERGLPTVGPPGGGFF